MRVAVVICLMMVASPNAAWAGRTVFGWLQDTDVMPERGAELATFVSENNRVADRANARQSNWWFAAAIGITDRLELVLPIEIEWSASDDAPAKTNFINFGADLRYRFVTADPVEKPALAPLLRIAAKRVIVGARDVWLSEINVVGSYETGKIRAAVDLGFAAEINPDEPRFKALPAIGVSVDTVHEIRVGAEVFSEISLNRSEKWLAAGPNIAWSHGRTWISAAYGIGLYHIRNAPKIQWGIAF